MKIWRKYAVVIVDYGTLKRTLQYIEDFLRAVAHEKKNLEFVIVDNWDKSDFKERQEHIGFQNVFLTYSGWNNKLINAYKNKIGYSNVWLLSVNHNLGYAKANNLGALFSKDILSSKYIIFSNNDIRFPESISLERFEQFFIKYPDCLLIGPEVVGLDGKRQGPILANDTAFGTLLRPYSLFRLFRPSLIKYPEYEFKFGKVHHVNGCFMVVNLKNFIMVGLFDENTFLYYEEDILSEKAKNLGLSCFFWALFKVIHEGGQTTKKRIIPIEQKKILFSSACYYFQKYRHVNSFFLVIAKMNFHFLFVPLYPLLVRFFKR